jgi:hypothetical protein
MPGPSVGCVYNIYRELEERKRWKISRRAAEPQRKRGDEAMQPPLCIVTTVRRCEAGDGLHPAEAGC